MPRTKLTPRSRAAQPAAMRPARLCGGDDPSAYVREVRDATRSFTRDLLLENERLRDSLSSREQDEQHVRELDEMSRTLELENRELRQRMGALERERKVLRDELERLRGRPPAAKSTTGGASLMERFTELEHRNAQLASLYTASLRLHAASDRTHVLITLQELIMNLVGSEEMAFFELEPGARTLRLMGSRGIAPERYARIPLGRGPIGQAAASGTVFLAEGAAARGEGPGATACIPLKIDGHVIGLIAIFRLLPEKLGPGRLQPELLELLAAHAAAALNRTRPPSSQERP